MWVEGGFQTAHTRCKPFSFIWCTVVGVLFSLWKVLVSRCSEHRCRAERWAFSLRKYFAFWMKTIVVPPPPTPPPQHPQPMPDTEVFLWRSWEWPWIFHSLFGSWLAAFPFVCYYGEGDAVPCRYHHCFFVPSIWSKTHSPHSPFPFLFLEVFCFM